MQSIKYLKPGGPLYVLISGLDPLNEAWMRYSLIRDIMVDNSGALFMIEHRYIGQSKPTPDMSLANLQYLTIKLAVKDIDFFITYIKNRFTQLKNSKVVVVGGSYAGSLAVWLREYYPFNVDAVWASSAILYPTLEVTSNR